MPRLRVLVLLALFGLGACAQQTPSRGRFPDSEWFETDILFGVAESGRPLATITISAPFRRLVFYRAADGYRAPYRLRAILRRGDESIQMKEWSGEAWVEDYPGTRGTLALQRTVTMELDRAARGAGSVLELQLLVEGSQRRGVAVVPIDVGRFREGGLVLGELAFYRQRDRNEAVGTELEVLDAALPDPDRFVRRNSASFDFATGEPWILVRIFDLRQERENDEFTLRLLTYPGTEETDPRWQRDLTVRRAGYETSVFLRMPVAALAFGTNRVEVRMADATDVTGKVENLGLDLSDGPSWRANLRQVEVLATEEEFDRLEAAEPGERLALWDAFWKRRDPDPATPENERLQVHYDRVAYARSFLRDGFEDGALSDRGRVWIRHGRPDSIDNSSPGFENYGNYEVWRYREAGIAYYFRDVDGLGRYRLVWQEGI